MKIKLITGDNLEGIDVPMDGVIAIEIMIDGDRRFSISHNPGSLYFDLRTISPSRVLGILPRAANAARVLAVDWDLD